MSVSEDLSRLSVIIGKDLDAQFTNRIWGAWLHVGYIDWQDRDIRIRNYDLVIRLATKSDIKLRDKVSKYIKDRYGLDGLIFGKDPSGYDMICCKGMSEDQVLNINTLFRMSNYA